MQMIENAINGRRAAVHAARTQPVFNPATGEEVARLPLSSAEDLNAAVAAAKAAAVSWGTMPPMKRVRPFFKFKELLEKNADEIARAISREHGKTHADALGELARGIDVVDFACGIPHLLKGEFSRNVGPDIDSWSDRQPLGVVAGITPFNFPAMVPMWMFPVAIACGNTFILKPSERDPSAPMLLWELFQEAGLKPVFSISCTAIRRSWTPSSTIRIFRLCRSSARRPSRNISTAAARPTESAFRLWAARRTT